MAATTVIDAAAVRAGMAEAQPEETDDQIEGQMDIMQWLAELEEEEKAAELKEAEEPKAASIEAVAAEDSTEAADIEAVAAEDNTEATEDRAEAAEAPAEESISSRDRERAAIREIAAAIEEAVAAGSKKTVQ